MATKEAEPVVEAREAYYWTGALPMPGVFKWRKPTADGREDEETGERFEYVDATAERLWHPSKRDDRASEKPSIWAGKCAKVQNVTCHQHDFIAYMNKVRVDENGMAHETPMPGAVVRWFPEMLKNIVSICYRTFYRNLPGIAGGLRWLDANRYEAPDPMNPHTLPVAQVSSIRFDKRTDMLVADCVYIQKVADVTDDNWNLEPQDFWRLNPTKAMVDIFKTPPRSVAECYPMGADGKIKFQ